MSEDPVIGRAGVLDLRVPQIELSWAIFNFAQLGFLLQPPHSRPSVSFLTSSVSFLNSSAAS